ncbi:hypothetical protein [uncultured Pontibacter sp.]|uniref:hypothetical protein n=1 Tax=uncultured Pontibacter sp. TaxID=453356 RepID=UPI0026158E4A|nr:hypothetical protein [uncultured Pontibacter sp.]
MDSKTHHTDPTTRQYVARNRCYEIAYDGIRNRIYYSILGFWKNTDSIPDFLSDWDKALQLVSEGFTLLIDMRTMITHPQQLNSLHEESRRKMKAIGVSKIANVMPVDKIANLQVSDLATRSHLPLHTFETCEAAEQWLNESVV